MKSKNVLQFPVKFEQAETVSEQDLLRLEWHRSRVAVIESAASTPERKSAIEAFEKADEAIKAYVFRPEAEVMEMPNVVRDRAVRALLIIRGVKMVKLQEFIHSKDFTNPEYFRLASEISKIEAKIDNERCKTGTGGRK